MTDEELTEEFIRVERDASSVSIMVREIRWNGPHKPVSEWVLGRKVGGDLSDLEVRQLVDGVLADESFFTRCRECGERNPRGWMHSSTLCQQCAELNHGVVY